MLHRGEQGQRGPGVRLACALGAGAALPGVACGAAPLPCVAHLPHVLRGRQHGDDGRQARGGGQRRGRGRRFGARSLQAAKREPEQAEVAPPPPPPPHC